MALIDCKECGQQISTKAESCPNCGAKVKKNISLGAFLVVIILSFFVFKSCSNNSVTTESTPSVQKESKQDVVSSPNIDVQILAKRFIRESAKDPNSVEFRHVTSNVTNKFGEVACGEFNAKNGFGGYNGFKRFISNGKTLFIEGENDSTIPFKQMWQEAC